MTRLSGKLPKDADKNGLDAIGRELLKEPKQRRIVIALVNGWRSVKDYDTETEEPIVRILRIEQIAPDDRAEAERLVRRALEYRSGDTVLPIDIERDLESWFGKDVTVDTTTGVVTVGSDDGPDTDDDEDSDDGGDAA